MINRCVGRIEIVGHLKVDVIKGGVSYPLNKHLFGTHFLSISSEQLNSGASMDNPDAPALTLLIK